jgi:uncharacterized membrane protein
MVDREGVERESLRAAAARDPAADDDAAAVDETLAAADDAAATRASSDAKRGHDAGKGSDGRDGRGKGSDGHGEGAAGFVRALPWYTAPALLLGVPALVWLLVLVAPETFYDKFVWKYYWGPIKADAAGMSLTYNGVTVSGGYNVVNTLSWAALMGVCILGATQLLTALRVRMNNTVIFGATAWVVAGALWHVLEDTDLIRPALQYFFITPPIYLLFAAFGILSLLTGVYMQRVAAAAGEGGLDRALQKLWLILALGVLLYVLAWVARWDQVVVYVHPVHVALFAAITYFVVRFRVVQTGRVEPREFILMLSVFPLLIALDYVAVFVAEPWLDARGLAQDPSDGLAWSVIAAPALALATVLVVRQTPARIVTGFLVVGGSIVAGVLGMLAVQNFAARLGITVLESGSILGFVLAGIAIAVGVAWTRRIRANFAATATEFGVALRSPINMLLVFSQMVDGFATALGLDLAGYSEKHILSAFIIDRFRDFAAGIGWTFGAENPTFLAFVPVKLIVSLAVVYAIDVYSKEDAAKSPTLIGFVKFAIIMVGIGPGVRDFARLSLGV